MNALGLYKRYAATSLRTQLQYPGAFLSQSLAQFGHTAAAMLAIWSLFDRFGNLVGWSLPEVGLLYGVAHITFALADSLGRGFDQFGQRFVRTGDFDRILLRPRATALQLLGHELRLTVGTLAQGILVFAVSLGALHIPWTLAKLTLLGLALLAGVCLFFAINILQATLSFWTIESLEIVNILSHGGIEASRYPLQVFERWLRRFITYAVPFACVNYYPVLAVLNKPDPLAGPLWLSYLGPCFGFAFLGAALFVWALGVRHYTSTGS